jgi:hypothetical protein
MQTYVVEFDGVPVRMFRSMSATAAARAAQVVKYPGVALVRPATIPEQAQWRSESIAIQDLFIGDGLGSGYDPNSYVSVLVDCCPKCGTPHAPEADCPEPL